MLQLYHSVRALKNRVILKNMKKYERWTVILLIVLCLCAVLFLRRKSTPSVRVGIYLNDELFTSFDPSEDQVIEMDGNYGHMVVEVKDGGWQVREVECPNHICEKMGRKTPEDLDPITCVPNGIIIMVESYAD